MDGKEPLPVLEVENVFDGTGVEEQLSERSRALGALKCSRQKHRDSSVGGDQLMRALQEVAIELCVANALVLRVRT